VLAMGVGMAAASAPPRPDLEAVLRGWCTQRASLTRTTRILALLNFHTFIALPLPPRTRRRLGATNAQWHRFLWRRHVGHILQWQERREEGDPHGFSDDINRLLRMVLFPNPSAKGLGDGDHD
jgi:hypothetical protein